MENEEKKTESYEPTTHDEVKWYHRRNMAYRALNTLIAIAFLLILIALVVKDITALVSIEGLLITIIIGLISIVGFYFGVTGWFDAVSKNKSNNPR